MKLRTIARSATVAWCPNDFYLAAGTLVGTMGEAFDSAGTLEIFDIGMKNNTDKVINEPKVSINTTDKLHKLVWSSDAALQSEKNPLGFLVGASDCGLHIWNPHLLMTDSQDPNVQLTIPKGHTSAVRGLDFNPLQPSLLCAGGANGEVLIWNLQTLVPYAPGTAKGPAGDSDITSVNWNRQVKHILATSAENGVVVVWDLRAKKPALSFKDPSRSGKTSSVLWHPDSKVNLITTSDDPQNPVIHCWDLKNYLAPSSTLSGHTGGVLSASFCPQDHNLLLSSGKDGKTLLWDLEKQKVLSEIESSSGWKFDVQWSPTLTCVSSTCSLDGKIDLHSLQDFRTSGADRVPPKWLRRPATVSFGFGGQLINVPFQDSNSPAKIEIHQINSDSDFLRRAEAFQLVIDHKAFSEYCSTKSEGDSGDKQIWEFMRVLFDNSPRDSLLNFLGFHPEKIPQEISEYIESVTKKETPATPPQSKKGKEPAIEEKPTETESKNEVSELFDGDDDGFDIASIASASLPKGHEASGGQPQETVVPHEPIDFNSADPVERLVTKCLLVGKWQSAVDCCFAAGRIADAFILANIGGPEMLIRTQQRYLNQQKSSFMSLLSVLSKKDFASLVQRIDLKNWRELLGILCAWTDNEFPIFCEQLGDRLVNEQKDYSSALLTYICAGNLEKTVQIWLNGDISSLDNLQSFIEKVTVFSSAISQTSLPPKIADLYARYAEQLASQGKLEVALGYLSNLKDSGSSASLLYHRIKTALDPNYDSKAGAAGVKPGPGGPTSPVHRGVDPRQSGPGSMSSAPFGQRPPEPHQHHQHPSPLPQPSPSPVVLPPPLHQTTNRNIPLKTPPLPSPGVGGNIGGYKTQGGRTMLSGQQIQPPLPGSSKPSVHPPPIHSEVVPPPPPSTFTSPPVHGVVQPPTPVMPPSRGVGVVQPPVRGQPGQSGGNHPIMPLPPSSVAHPPPAIESKPPVDPRTMQHNRPGGPGPYVPAPFPHTESAAPQKKKEPEVVAPPPMGASVVARKVVEEDSNTIPFTEVEQKFVHLVSLLAESGTVLEEHRVNDLKLKLPSLPGACLTCLNDLFDGFLSADVEKINSAFGKLNSEYYAKVGSTSMIGLRMMKTQVQK